MPSAPQLPLSFDVASGASGSVVPRAPGRADEGEPRKYRGGSSTNQVPTDTRCIWDGDRQAFVSGTLRQVMLTRGFTAASLSRAAGVAHGTMYNALAGRPTRLCTARRILETLAAVEPAFLLADLA